MLRYLVLILFIVNATFLAWSQGWLKAAVGVQPDAQHEPDRLRQQQHAERITVLSGASAASAPADAASTPAAGHASASAASGAASGEMASGTAGLAPAAAASMAPASTAPSGICLQAGPFRNEDMAEVRNALKAPLPADAWSTQTVPISGIWLVYMGPYADEELYEKKLNELRRIKGLNFDEVRTPPALAHGLSLGRYTSLSEAQSGLATMKLRGIRTARIVVLRPEAEMQLVRVPQASQPTQVALSAVKLPQGKAFSACQP